MRTASCTGKEVGGQEKHKEGHAGVTRETRKDKEFGADGAAGVKTQTGHLQASTTAEWGKERQKQDRRTWGHARQGPGCQLLCHSVREHFP